LGEACRGTNKHVYAIDPWQNYSEYDGTGIVSASGLNSFDEVYETFKSHIKNFKLEDYITPLRSFSLEIAKSWSYGPINLTFIDANHNYQPVLDDLRAWSRLTAGALCGDDWDFQLFSTECYYPVREAVYDFIKESQRYTLEIPCDNTWLLRDSKSAQIGPGLEAPPNNPF
jgi:hypothetical protein